MAENLFEQVVKNTGLPEDMISQDFLRLLSDKGLGSDSLTLDQLRDVLAEYLQDVFISAKEELK